MDSARDLNGSALYDVLQHAIWVSEQQALQFLIWTSCLMMPSLCPLGHSWNISQNGMLCQLYFQKTDTDPYGGIKSEIKDEEPDCELILPALTDYDDDDDETNQDKGHLEEAIHASLGVD